MAVTVRIPTQLRSLSGDAAEVQVDAATVADEDIRFMQGVDTPLDAGTTVSIVPAVAGG